MQSIRIDTENRNRFRSRLAQEYGKPTANHSAAATVAGLLSILALLAVACAPNTRESEADARSALTTATAPSSIQVGAASWNADPPFYRVESEKGARLEILGTLHIGPSEGWSFPPHIERSRHEADSILIEVDLRSISEEDISQSIMRYGILPPNTPLSTLISPETARLFEVHEKTLTENGAPPHVRAAMKPWLITLLLAEASIRDLGFSNDKSVEGDLMQILGDRELMSLEGFEEQLGFFARVEFPLQEAMLQISLEQWDEAEAELAKLIDAWRTNDHEALLRVTRDGVDEKPELEAFYDILFDQRNRNWIPRLAELLEDPTRAGTTVLVAVGAGHLLGPNGVPSLLRAQGYRVEAAPATTPTAITSGD